MDILWCVAGFTFCLVDVFSFSTAIFWLLLTDLISSQAHILTSASE
jgi:hypothetical protein